LRDPTQSRSSTARTVPVDFAALPDGSYLDLVKDPDEKAALRLLWWKAGARPSIIHRIQIDGRVLVPPAIDPALIKALRLASGIRPCGELVELLGEIEVALTEVVDLPAESVHLISKFVLSTWFPDRLSMAPYLWVVGPLQSGKTTLARFLHAVCRRALLVGDLTTASLYQLPSLLLPTLLIDEANFGSSRLSLDLQRLLRTGNTPGVHAVRNGRPYETYCPKAIISRQLPDDAALTSRAIVIRMSPTGRKLRPLDSEWLNRVAEGLQAKLLMFRFLNYAKVGKSKNISSPVEHLSPRMKDLARALAASLLGNSELQMELILALEKQDEEAQLERFEEREWLVIEELVAVCHEGKRHRIFGWIPVSEVLIGGVAGGINDRLELRGDSRRFSAKAIGVTLQALGMPRERLGKLGRGIRLTPAVRRKIHQLARDYGFTRRDLLPAPEPCELCKQYDVTGRLKFAELLPEKRLRRPSGRSTRRLLKKDPTPVGPQTKPSFPAK